MTDDLRAQVHWANDDDERDGVLSVRVAGLPLDVPKHVELVMRPAGSMWAWTVAERTVGRAQERVPLVALVTQKDRRRLASAGRVWVAVRDPRHDPWTDQADLGTVGLTNRVQEVLADDD
jgi:hypothetical protein